MIKLNLIKKKLKKKESKTKMGSSQTKTSDSQNTDNKGLLNGNLINNGNIITEIDSDLISIRQLMYIIVAVLMLNMMITIFKIYQKNQKGTQLRNQRLDSMIVPRNNAV